MWTNIIGGFLVVFGAAFLARPEYLRRKLLKKGVRSLKRYIFAATLALGALLVSAGWGHEGLLPKVLTAAGVLVMLRGIFLAKAKSVNLLAAQLARIPAIYLRLFAAVQVAIGGLLIFVLKQ